MARDEGLWVKDDSRAVSERHLRYENTAIPPAEQALEEGPRQRRRIDLLRRSSHLRSGKHASRAKGIPISSSRAKSRDIYSRTINDEYEKAEKRRNKTSVFFGALLRMTAVQWRFLDCARNDDTGKPLSKHAGIFVIGISLLVS